jgi:hypothetical protein
MVPVRKPSDRDNFGLIVDVGCISQLHSRIGGNVRIEIHKLSAISEMTDRTVGS